MAYNLYMNKGMPKFEFSADKNQQLIKERGISFDDIIVALGDGKLINIIKHHNETEYPNQQIYVVDIDGYVHLVPFVRKDEETVFLKTIFPSRKMTKKHLKSGDQK